MEKEYILHIASTKEGRAKQAKKIIQRAISAKRESAKYFKEHGTFTGFTPNFAD